MSTFATRILAALRRRFSERSPRWQEAYSWSCTTLAVGLASIDGLCHLAQLHPGTTVGVGQFLAAYSAGIAFYFVLALALWSTVLVLVVKLGGVRTGIGYLFTVLLMLGFVVATNVLDIRYRRVMNDLWDARPLFVAAASACALTAATLAALVVGKLVRGGPYPICTRGGGALAFALAGATATFLGLSVVSPGHHSAVIVFAIILVFGVACAAHFHMVRRAYGLSLSGGALLCLSLLALPSAVTWQSVAQAAPTFEPKMHAVRHVILVTIDTLRQDAVTTFNTTRGITRELDRIGTDGVAFDNAFTSAPWTLPSLASMMTGLPFTVHGTVRADSVLPEPVTTLAETMADAGYRTVGIGNNFFAAPRTNINQGFQEYYWDPSPLFKVESFDVGLAHWLWTIPMNLPTGTDVLTNRAIAWTQAHQNDDFFLWLHYFDPHLPYDPPAAYRPKGVDQAFSNTTRVRQGTLAKTQEERDTIRALYDGEVRYVDANVGRFLDALQQGGMYDDALIIVTSDHGEEFWDHDGMEHGHTLYNELLRVPLLVKTPSSHTASHSKTSVSTASIPSTVFEICDISPRTVVPLVPSLAPLLFGEETRYRAAPLLAGAPLYFENKTCVVFDSKKYIHNEVTGLDELYDLKIDPLERHSIIRDEPEAARAGLQSIEAAMTESASARELLGLQANSSAALNPEDIHTLKAVGYL